MKWISNKVCNPELEENLFDAGTSLNEPDFKKRTNDWTLRAPAWTIRREIWCQFLWLWDLKSLVSFLSALRLGYADMASGSFGVELWILASRTSLVGFLDVGCHFVSMFFFVGRYLAVDWRLGMNCCNLLLRTRIWLELYYRRFFLICLTSRNKTG
ncbi:hypothetical protein C1646_821931 [Rhizophagus diaphanus]|nr:hypothetical protein C1646_821931 [Rhizophagus diaphanus] [Rhizophagus sp. MUCL 43196]